MITYTKKKQVQAKQATATVQSSTKSGGVEHVVDKSTETVGPHVLFSEPTCNVGVRAGLTIPMGNYSSARVEVSLNVPCLDENIDKAFDFARDWVDAKLQTLVERFDDSKSG